MIALTLFNQILVPQKESTFEAKKKKKKEKERYQEKLRYFLIELATNYCDRSDLVQQNIRKDNNKINVNCKYTKCFFFFSFLERVAWVQCPN